LGDRWEQFRAGRQNRRLNRQHGAGTTSNALKAATQRIIDEAKADITEYVEQITEKIKTQTGQSAHLDKLIRVFKKTFMNTIDTTVRPTQEGRVFVITGDIHAMWLRDSVPQVEHYLECCAASSPAVREMLVRLVHEHAFLALQDPYANAFNDPPQYQDTRALFRRGGYVSTGNYELDSFGYSTRLAYLLWKRTGTDAHLDELFRTACRLMLVVWKKEQRHAETTTYKYTPNELRINGIENSPTKYTGMTWTGFRPSDDPCVYHYNIPDNMLTSVALRQMAEIARDVYNDEDWANAALQLKNEIDEGIRAFGTVHHPKYGMVYAYEVDGMGNSILEDDANVPSLLSIPYLNYTEADPTILSNTLRMVWSQDNKWFFRGSDAEGIGSSHTGHQQVWHMSIIMKGIITSDEAERARLLNMCLKTDGGTDLMHESFNPSHPRQFTRAWFAWVNSLFGYWVARMAEAGDVPRI
jgi:hypothetical protein